MSIPRIQLAIGSLIVGGVTLSSELGLGSTLHKVVLLVAGVILFLLNPQTTSPEEAYIAYSDPPAPPASAQTARPPA